MHVLNTAIKNGKNERIVGDEAVIPGEIDALNVTRGTDGPVGKGIIGARKKIVVEQNLIVGRLVTAAEIRASAGVGIPDGRLVVIDAVAANENVIGKGGNGVFAGGYKNGLDSENIVIEGLAVVNGGRSRCERRGDRSDRTDR